MLMGLLLFVVSYSVSVLISGNFKAGKFDKSLYVGKGELRLMMSHIKSVSKWTSSGNKMDCLRSGDVRLMSPDN